MPGEWEVVSIADREWIAAHSGPLQGLVMGLVENTQPIDPAEPFWEYFLLYSRGSGGGRRVLAGLATAYQFHKNAFDYRARISQVLVLPPFRKRGLGSALSEAVYARYPQDLCCFEISVEEASE